MKVDGAVRTTDWAGCAGGTNVRLIAVEGGGHNWFAPEFEGVTGAVDTTAALIEFFGLDRP